MGGGGYEEDALDGVFRQRCAGSWVESLHGDLRDIPERYPGWKSIVNVVKLGFVIRCRRGNEVPIKVGRGGGELEVALGVQATVPRLFRGCTPWKREPMHVAVEALSCIRGVVI